MFSSPVRDLLLLVGRIGLGVVFFMHGWQKLDTMGYGGVGDGFAQMGAPFPQITGPLAMTLELVGGAALVLGAFVGIFGVLLAALMAGAWAVVHAGAGFYVTDGGPSYVIALGSGALAVAAVGAGRFSLGGGSRRQHSTAKEPVNA